MRSTRRPLAAAALAVALVGAGCGGDNDSDDDASQAIGLTPQFPVAPSDQGGSSTTAPGQIVDGSTPVGGGIPPEEPGAPSSDTTAAPPPTDLQTLESAFADRAGDLTLSVDPPPPWADLVGGRLIRHADGFELRVTLDGGTAPNSSGDSSHTMNVASFYDVDGDGYVDYEIWGNLAQGGWGGSWFDIDGGQSLYSDESGVAITVEGADVVLRFPLAHLGGASQFRWALASEWGQFVAIGTTLAARDDAPDNDQPANFPS